MKNFKKLHNVTTHVGRVETKPRFIGYHNCQESQLVEKNVLGIKEDKNGKQDVERETIYVCFVCEATYRKE
jgi:hypothetical protein